MLANLDADLRVHHISHVKLQGKYSNFLASIEFINVYKRDIDLGQYFIV